VRPNGAKISATAGIEVIFTTVLTRQVSDKNFFIYNYYETISPDATFLRHFDAIRATLWL
jgi:hypothetical protein